MLQSMRRNSKSTKDRGTTPRTKLTIKSRSNRRGNRRRQKRKMSNINSRRRGTIRPTAMMTKSRTRRRTNRSKRRRNRSSNSSNNTYTPRRAKRRIRSNNNNTPSIFNKKYNLHQRKHTINNLSLNITMKNSRQNRRNRRRRRHNSHRANSRRTLLPTSHRTRFLSSQSLNPRQHLNTSIRLNGTIIAKSNSLILKYNNRLDASLSNQWTQQ